MGEAAERLLVVVCVHPDGETVDVLPCSSAAVAYRTAATLLVERRDEWHPRVPQDCLVQLFLEGRYRELVELWTAAHDGAEGYGRLALEAAVVDAGVADTERVRERARRWLYDAAA